nr:hypothetical protein B0A51_12140 [Rachicladosporium sp. CCFEE 5018]
MADMDTYDQEPRAAYEGTHMHHSRRHLTYEDLDDPYSKRYPTYRWNDRELRDYGRDRSRSPQGDRDGDIRLRDEPSNGRSDRGPPPARRDDQEDESVNPGSNLFVTGIHPRLTEEEISTLFEKYGPVEKCNIMRDPHTRESRGFGFVKMVDSTGADAAKEALQGEVYEGRTLSIEKARRAKPRTPTPGKYFGPPKREDRPPGRGPPGGYRDRYDDRGDRGGYGRRDDRRGGGGGYRDRYDDRGSGRRDDYAPRIDRYASSRDDRYGGDRRGGGDRGGYDRASRGPPPDRYGGDAGHPAGGAGAPPPREYDERPRRYD